MEKSKGPGGPARAFVTTIPASMPGKGGVPLRLEHAPPL